MKRNIKNKKWYIKKADAVKAKLSGGLGIDENGIDIYTKKKANYDLFNGKMNPNVARYIIYPIDEALGELPAKFRNIDISSDKIKTLLGMETSRPFKWTVLSVNPDIIQEKERKFYKNIEKFVYAQVEKEIRLEVLKQHEKELKNRELTEQEVQQLQQRIEQEIISMTPEEAKKQLERNEKHVLEMTDYEILQAVVKEKDIDRKFDMAFKHGLLSARQIAYISNFNNNPDLWIVNPLHDFNFSSSDDNIFIENSEEIYAKYYMKPNKIIELFGTELKDIEIKEILDNKERHSSTFTWTEGNNRSYDDMQVEHVLWREPLKIGFLEYINEQTGEIERLVVNENYTAREGEKIEWEWINEIYETWIINNKYYVNMQPIKGQLMDIYNLIPNPMPYYGIIYDNLNSEETSLADRLYELQVFYNIIYYKIELLASSDKGKKLLMNIQAIPTSSGIDLKEWMQYFESTPFTFFNSKEAGMNVGDLNQVAKVLDMSLASDLNVYIKLAMSIKQEINDVVGISRQMIGQLENRDAVANVRQSIIQSSYVVNSYFDLHTIFKRNVLNALLTQTKISLYNSNRKYLTYTLDNLSAKIVKIDRNLLTNFSTGIYVEELKNVEEVIQTAKAYVQQALSTSSITIQDAIRILRSNSLIEIEEMFEKNERDRQKMQQQLNKQKEEEMMKLKQQEEAVENTKHKNKLEEIKKEYEEKRENIIIQESIKASSFNPDKDVNKNGVNDYIDNIKKIKDMVIKERDMLLKEKKFEFEKRKNKK